MNYWDDVSWLQRAEPAKQTYLIFHRGGPSGAISQYSPSLFPDAFSSLASFQTLAFTFFQKKKAVLPRPTWKKRTVEMLILPSAVEACYLCANECEYVCARTLSLRLKFPAVLFCFMNVLVFWLFEVFWIWEFESQRKTECHKSDKPIILPS